MMMIVLLLNASISWSMNDSFTGGRLQTDTAKVLVPVSIIKKANIKLIQGKHNAQLVKLQETTIAEQRIVINELDSINIELQNSIRKCVNDNTNYQYNLEKYKERSRITSWAAGISGSAFVLLLIIIL